MQYNFFPGRLRFRDPILRDEDIRNAALEVVHIICPEAEVSYKESNAGILAIYPSDAVNPDDLKPLIPYLLKIEPKVRFYSSAKKIDILTGIEDIKKAAEKIMRSL
ncbi:hypothetical protein [Treponema sp.]|uniref:hypothetical protein n=1 Tax=Treponema sp. TaxID=166 RepID=UPI00298DDF16|nr:hypothetical protein [Treponema sp.]MCR5612786.1 hypothetical protein [Treponema sp.]